MKVIKPRPYDPAMRVSTTATEAVSAWSSSTTYADGDQTHADGSIWESLAASNTANAPATSPSWWIKLGPDNRSAMFDSQVSTQTVQASGPLEVVLDTGAITALGMVGISGGQVDVEMTDGASGPVVYQRSISLDASVVTDWFDYFFAEFDFSTEVVLTDIPPYTDSRVTVSIDGGSAVGCGALVFGSVHDLGVTEHGATAGIVDYSRKDTDEFGNTTFVQRAFARRVSARMLIPNSRLRAVQRTLSGLRATPSMWIGTERIGYDPLIVFGWYRDFSIDVQYPTHSYVSLEIEGLA